VSNFTEKELNFLQTMGNDVCNYYNVRMQKTFGWLILIHQSIDFLIQKTL